MKSLDDCLKIDRQESIVKNRFKRLCIIARPSGIVHVPHVLVSTNRYRR